MCNQIFTLIYINVKNSVLYLNFILFFPLCRILACLYRKLMKDVLLCDVNVIDIWIIRRCNKWYYRCFWWHYILIILTVVNENTYLYGNPRALRASQQRDNFFFYCLGTKHQPHPSRVSQEHSLPPMSSEILYSLWMLFQTGQKATCLLSPCRFLSQTTIAL